jgi:hypothetical protein
MSLTQAVIAHEINWRARQARGFECDAKGRAGSARLFHAMTESGGYDTVISRGMQGVLSAALTSGKEDVDHGALINVLLEVTDIFEAATTTT